ncbi:MAG: prepilin-type N-terminal cleavage/methylation domain-containing protein [Sporolactobacillus sp.]
MILKKFKNKQGFTLIELLAVIVILAILAAIAIPAVVTIINNQNQKSLAQNALNAIHAAKLYVADNNQTSPITLTTAGTAASQTSMANYVDKAGGVNGDYAVSVTFDSSGNATYTACSGNLPGGASSEGESQLIYFSKNGSYSSTAAETP